MPATCRRARLSPPPQHAWRQRVTASRARSRRRSRITAQIVVGKGLRSPKTCLGPTRKRPVAGRCRLQLAQKVARSGAGAAIQVHFRARFGRNRRGLAAQGRAPVKMRRPVAGAYVHPHRRFRGGAAAAPTSTQAVGPTATSHRRDIPRGAPARCADRPRPLDRPCYNREGRRAEPEEPRSARPANLKIGMEALFRRRFSAADGGDSPLIRAVAPRSLGRHRCILERPPRACIVTKRPAAGLWGV